MTTPAIYRSVPPTLWADPDFRALGCAAKTVVLWLYTGRYTSMAGVAEIPHAYIAHEAGVPLEHVPGALGAAAKWVTCDAQTDELFMHLATAWNCQPVTKPEADVLKDNRRRHLVRQLAEARSISLRAAWIAQYGNVWKVTKTDIGLEAPYQAPSEGPSKATLKSQGKEKGQGQGQPKAEAQPHDQTQPRQEPASAATPDGATLASRPHEGELLARLTAELNPDLGRHHTSPEQLEQKRAAYKALRGAA